MIPGQAGHEMPSSAVDLRCPITARSDAQPACLQKVVDVHVCPCLCQAPSVCQSSGRRRGGRRLTVRPSLTYFVRPPLCRFVMSPSLWLPYHPPPPIDAIKAGLSEQRRNQAARDAIIPASRSRPTCCDADIKHRDSVGGRC